MGLVILLLIFLISLVITVRSLVDFLVALRAWWHQYAGEQNANYSSIQSTIMETDPKVKVEGDFIKVESGATMIKVAQGGTNNIYHGPRPIVQKDPPLESIKQSIKKMVDNKILNQKQDFGIVYEITLELHVYPVDGYAGFVKLLGEWFDVIPKAIRPSAGNISTWNFGNNDYPNWKFGKREKSDVSRICAIAEAYIEAMAEHGWKHASRHE